ncbi:hypothetical protein L198_03893 [Cryptococcus wingfieldii CBS 7118]|uniref:Uncharacterized protein n=1 Tax=Cryptococcus wingfieldii CBS 7118 TaxID=1295528 RepID=A0A1E3J8Y0_9TREE|nr:hypothetical protein L198_03893 [Cryptococcus wingfieldii CBS 7118]ODN97330.1 hypothetical protein L198_03893 [Cryptococcus wingfieldii CBS 7118]
MDSHTNPQGAHSQSPNGEPRQPSPLNQDYSGFVSSVFPIPGSRRAGVPSSVSQSAEIPPQDIERHQRSSNGSIPSDPFHDARRGTFPTAGALPPHGRKIHVSYDLAASPEQPGSSHSQIHPISNSPQMPMSDNDSISAFLAEMPTMAEDPARHVLWTELVRLKTKSLELQIAEAKRKEKEAELELARLQSGAVSRNDGGSNAMAGPSGSNDLSAADIAGSQDTSSYGISQQIMPPQHQLEHHQNQQPYNVAQHQLYGAPQSGQAPCAMSPFDLDALLQTDTNNFLSWLPDFGGHDISQSDQAAPYGAMLSTSHDLPSTSEHKLVAQPSPAPPSPPDIHSPPTKRSKRTTEKKTVVEQACICTSCSEPLARVLIRAPKSQIPNPINVSIKCLKCAPVQQPSTLPDPNQTASGSAIGTVETRKRMRTSMEIDDEDAKVVERRAWCDVCQKVVGSGQLIGGRQKENISHMAEIVCVSCDSKYQRCTDCGGGGGPRVGIGKWRMKQVFHPGRKTCSLSHTRLGDRTRELGVHVTPTDFTPEQMKEVLSRCKALWNEKTLSRLAIPEMLEVDLPADFANPLRDFADVDDIVTRNWPSREAMIHGEGIDQTRFKRLLSLIWAHSKPRRTVRTVDLEEEWTKQADENDHQDMSTVLANVRRTNVVIPAGSELIGMWGGEWDMQNGSLLISTFIPFEGTDGDDSTALSVGEMITKVQGLLQEINTARTVQAALEGRQPVLLPPCQHLWTVSGGYIPLVRERFADVLVKKRAFVHLEEYLTRHPEFIECVKARPVGLHPDIHRPIPVSDSNDADASTPRPLILVRWLGNDFDAQKFLEIKQMEFGGAKGKTKKRPRGKA